MRIHYKTKAGQYELTESQQRERPDLKQTYCCKQKTTSDHQYSHVKAWCQALTLPVEPNGKYCNRECAQSKTEKPVINALNINATEQSAILSVTQCPFLLTLSVVLIKICV